MIPLEELKIPTGEFDAPGLLAHWAWRIPGHLQPLFLSTFGDWFFRDADGHVHMFDLVAGELKQVADSCSEFETCLDLEHYQREWLMSHLVEQLRSSGVARTRGQCYAFRTPPMLGGKLSTSNMVVWGIACG
jgi:T6SS immunity protein Tdi1, C-terminal